MIIIKIDGLKGIHQFETQSHRTENWMGDGWAVVPKALEQKTMSFLPFILLTVENGVVTSVEDDTEARNAQPADHTAQIAALKQQLLDTDYQAIKYAEGWLTAEEYAPIKAQRQAWRDEINTLEVQQQC